MIELNRLLWKISYGLESFETEEIIAEAIQKIKVESDINLSDLNNFMEVVKENVDFVCVDLLDDLYELNIVALDKYCSGDYVIGSMDDDAPEYVFNQNAGFFADLIYNFSLVSYCEEWMGMAYERFRAAARSYPAEISEDKAASFFQAGEAARNMVLALDETRRWVRRKTPYDRWMGRAYAAYRCAANSSPDDHFRLKSLSLAATYAQELGDKTFQNRCIYDAIDLHCEFLTEFGKYNGIVGNQLRNSCDAAIDGLYYLLGKVPPDWRKNVGLRYPDANSCVHTRQYKREMYSAVMDIVGSLLESD